MAYTIAIKDTVSPNDVNVSIHELGADFNQSNYIRVIWSSTPIAAQGQSTPPANILCSVNAPASGTSRRVDSGFTLGSPASTHIVNGVIYGTAQAANGLYYKAGQDVMSDKLEVVSLWTEDFTYTPELEAMTVHFIVDGFEFAVNSNNYTKIALLRPNGNEACIASLSSSSVHSENPNSAYTDGYSNIACIPKADIGKTYSFVAYVPNHSDTPYHIADVIIPAPAE